jgi:hypothetical protein
MEGVRDFFTKGPLGTVVLILVIVVACFISWRAVNAVNDNSGFKPAPILTPAQQTADIENTVKQVESNPQMPEDAKQRVIATLRSHEPGNGASTKSAQNVIR